MNSDGNGLLDYDGFQFSISLIPENGKKCFIFRDVCAGSAVVLGVVR